MKKAYWMDGRFLTERDLRAIRRGLVLFRLLRHAPLGRGYGIVAALSRKILSTMLPSTHAKSRSVCASSICVLQGMNARRWINVCSFESLPDQEQFLPREPT